MNRHRWTLFVIVFITILTFWISLPNYYQLNFSLGSLHVNQTINRPWIPVPYTDYSLGWDTYLKTGLDIQGGSYLEFEADMSGIQESDRPAAIESTRENIERRIDLFGVSESQLQTAQQGEQYRLIIQLPGVQNSQEAVELIGQTARLDFRVPNYSTESAQPYVSTGLTGSNLARSVADYNPQTGEPVVRLEFDDEGRKLFADLTQQYIGQEIGIFLDETPLSFPIVNEPIITGDAIITGGPFTTEEAKQLAVQLNAGALPVPIELVRQQQVGASLGQDVVQASIRAGFIGLSLVMIFMIGTYGWLGLISNLGLVLYGLITLAVYKLMGVTLTLPGIAGFILSVGMAVDANILIFERLREEQWRGRPLRTAVERAFGRAWDSIRDANVCTVITSLVLYYLTTSTIRGFAVTLGLGIVVSLFTGVVVTRNLIRLLYVRKL